MNNLYKKELLTNLIISITSLTIFFSIGEIATRVIVGVPLITQPDDILFWKYKKDQAGYQKLYSPISRVDKNGFRFSGKEFNPDLPSVYVGGDSFAWGEGVLDSETFSAQLQKLLISHNIMYNVLNGGVPGYGIEQIINRMEIECKKYRPKYAIFLWTEGDLDRLRDISSEQKKKYLRDYKIRSMFRYSAFLKMMKEQIFDKLLHKELGFGWYVDRNKQYGKTHSFKEKIEAITPKIKDNVSFLKSKNIIPIWVFVTVPSKEFKDYLASLSKELSIVLVDPEAVYRENFPGLKNMATKHSAHFIPEVYKILANKVFKKVFVIK